MKFIYQENGKYDLKAMLERNIEAIRVNEEFEFDILYFISEQSDIEALDKFIELGLNVNVRHSNLETVMNYLNYASVEFVERLIEHGVNIHAIDSNGYTGLLSLSLSKVNVAAQHLLVEKGLNPFNPTFNGFSSLDYNSALESLVSLDSTNTNNRKDLMFEECMENGLYNLALKDIYLRIENMGGLEKVIGYIRYSNGYNTLQKLQEAFIYNGMTKEGSHLFKLLIRLDDLNCMHVNKNPISFVPSIIEGDIDSIFSFINKNIKHYVKSEKELTYYLVLGCLLANKVGDSKSKKNYLNQLSRKRFVYDIYTKEFAGITLSNDSDTTSGYIKKLIDSLEEYSVEVKSEIIFLLGIYYFSEGDYLSAETKFREVVQLSSNKEKGCHKEYASAYLLVEYLKDKVLFSA